MLKPVDVSSDAVLKVSLGEFVLQRLPKRPLELLRAWDAADEYVLEVCAERLKPAARVLIVNDSFGALAVALHAFAPTAVSDSYLSQQATRLNLAANGLALQTVTLANSLEPIAGVFDVVFIKTPKTLALLEDQLIRLRPCLGSDCQVIVAGMVKNMPSAIWTLLERLLGPTTTGLAKKKARLIYVVPNPDLPPVSSPYPVSYPLEGTAYTLSNHANVFSRDSLDIGARFFLQHLPHTTGAVEIIDLACGNGVLGIMAATQNPNAKLHFVDESYMAVASARDNFQRALGGIADAEFYVGDGLTAFPAACADIILCNPPFHQHNTVGDHIALGLFAQAKKALKPGGELWIVANRHLNYATALKRLFGQYWLVASNAKFVVLKVKA